MPSIISSIDIASCLAKPESSHCRPVSDKKKKVMYVKIAWERRKRIGSTIFLFDRAELYVNGIKATFHIFCMPLKKVGRTINGVAPVTGLLDRLYELGFKSQ